MRNLIFYLILLSMCRIGASQDAFKTDTEKYFIVLYTLGENWDQNKQAHEQSYFDQHSSHLSKLRKEKHIVMGARFSQTGMIIVRAEDETDANEIIRSDIAIQNGLFKVEIHSFNPFYTGCIE